MSDYAVIPQQAIDSLYANPEKAGGFDAVFGAGRAAELLAARQPAPEPKQEKTPEMSLWGKVWDSTGRAVSYGAQEAANETIDAVESFDIWASQKLDGLGVPSRLQIVDSEGNFAPNLKYYRDSLEDTDFLGGTVGNQGDAAEINMVDQPQTVVGGVVGGISQFAVGFLGAGKFTKLAGLRGAFVNGAIADALVFDPNDANVTKMLEDFGVNTGIMKDVLATDPDDPEWMNRLRNAGEGVVLGGVVEAIGWGIKAARARKMGRPEEAAEHALRQEEALKELDQAVKEAADETAREARNSVDMTRRVIDEIAPEVELEVRQPTKLDVADVDGQLALDLGDTPLPKPRADTVPEKGRLYVTPEKAENIRLQAGLARGASATEKQNMFSYRSPRTFQNVEDVIDEMAGTKAVMADEFAKLKGGEVQRWKTVVAQSVSKARNLARMYGEDEEQFIRTMLKANLGDINKMAAEVHARENIALGAQQEVRMLGKALGDFVAGKPVDFGKLPGITNADELRLAFEKSVSVAANAVAGTDALRSNMARAFNAMKLAKKGDQSMREMLRNPEYFKNTDAMARALADPANADKPAVQVINSTLSVLKDVGDKINTVRINALLSGPGTQEVNMISNAIQMLYIPAHQAIGGALTGNRQMVVHAMRQLQGQTAGLLDFVGTALKAGYENNSILDAFSNKVEGSEEFGKVFGVKAVDNVITAPSRLLMTMDELFKQSQYRGRVFADANLEATQQGLKGKAREDFIKQYLAESYSDTGAALRGDALLQARRATFTEPLEPGLASMIQAAAIQQPIIRFFVPFIRTPVNILSQTFQHAPVLGMVSSRWRADIAAGGVRAAQARGKQVVGAGLVAAAGYMATKGYITGSGPSDPRIRRVWLKNNQPYSFKIQQEDGTTRWISYARLEPMSNVFSIAADSVEIMNDEYNESHKTMAIQALTMSVMENTVNKTFTQGIYDAMSLFVGRPHEQEAALRNFVSSFVPNVLNQTNGDDALREARTITDAIMAKTHLYNGVDPKRNVLGEPIVRTLPKYDPLGLTKADIRETDNVLKEITRVGILNQTVADNPGKTIPGPNKIDLTQIDYKDGQSLYDRWVELTGTVEINGMTLRERLETEMNGREYLKAPDGYIGSTSGTKGARIRNIITSYRNRAKAEVPEILELERSEKRGGAMILRGQLRSNRELFPATNTIERSIRRRTFDDLLNQ